MLVVRATEILSGAYRYEDAPLRPRGLVLSLVLEIPIAWPIASEVPVTGCVTAEALATEKPLEGRLFGRDGSLACALRFSDDTGDAWWFRGSLRFRRRAWRHSLTRVTGLLAGGGRRARAEVRLDWHREVARFLGSLTVDNSVKSR